MMGPIEEIVLQDPHVVNRHGSVWRNFEGMCHHLTRILLNKALKSSKTDSYSFKIYRDNGVTLEKERTKNVIVLVKQVRVTIKSEHTKNGMQVESYITQE